MGVRSGDASSAPDAATRDAQPRCPRGHTVPHTAIARRTLCNRGEIPLSCRRRDHERGRLPVAVLAGRDVRTGPGLGSCTRRRSPELRRYASRPWSRSRTFAGSASASGTPPRGGLGGMGGCCGPLPQPSSESESEGPGGKTKRQRRAGTNSAAANTRHVHENQGIGSGDLRPPRHVIRVVHEPTHR